MQSNTTRYTCAQNRGDAVYTPTGLVQHLRQAAGTGRAPIGIRQIRAAIRSGELQASWVGNRKQIQWMDFIRWLDGPARVHSDANTDENLNAEVAAQLRRECAVAVAS